MNGTEARFRGNDRVGGGGANTVRDVPKGAARPFSYAPPHAPFVCVHHLDDNLLVLEKPSGLLSVPGKAAHHSDCLQRRAEALFANALLVHRLDMDTSGLFVMAMNKKAQRHLGLQFERRHVDKTYEAWVTGTVEANEGEIDAPLRCDWPNRPRQMVDHVQGRSALTRFEVVTRTASSSFVRLFPQTGRSHQLRVHMAHIGHPILGDNLYADDAGFGAADRLMLHASRLELHHPDGGRRIAFSSPSPFQNRFS